MLRNKFPAVPRGPVAALMLLVLVAGALLQGACLSHLDGGVVAVETVAPAASHDCDTAPHPHPDEHLRQPAIPAASADLALPDTGASVEAASIAPGLERVHRPAPAGADLLTRLCVFRI